MKVKRQIEVLLVEDNPGDVRLMIEAFRETNGSIVFHVATDGVEAMDFLQRKAQFAGAPRPDLILLDLNLPRMDGREVLARIKSDSDLRLIPTIILTSSESHADVQTGYSLNANCYLKKPVQLDVFESLVRSINEFWLTNAILPHSRTDDR
ncbi:MAG TPA: response regulator [Kofleriaceae bacterium]|nr:response regulator [Kofleriaceae bacterium]